MDIAGTVGAITALLASIGGAGGWLWNRIDTRFKSIEKQLNECEKREKRNLRTLTVYETALTVVMTELQHLKPDSFALEQAKSLLRRLSLRAERLLNGEECEDDDDDILFGPAEF